MQLASSARSVDQHHMYELQDERRRNHRRNHARVADADDTQIVSELCQFAPLMSAVISAMSDTDTELRGVADPARHSSIR